MLDAVSQPRALEQSTSMRLKLYITLKVQADPTSSENNKKMLLMIEDSLTVIDLKRRIEREFAELFPAEPPYVVAKIEDSNGFAFSNMSFLRDLCVTG